MTHEAWPDSETARSKPLDTPELIAAIASLLKVARP